MSMRIFGNVSARRRVAWSATMMHTTNGSISKPGWKFALDVTCILLALPIWLPVMILLMLVTRIASPGPIFYRQERVGLGGKHFFIWKFRTMQVSAETQTHEHYFHELMRVDRPMTKLDAYGDPRLAPFGRFLRASGLDELPQIFNVLCGEMSLVGPRPCTPNEFAHYEVWQRERVNGLPGLTGYWQVNGKNKTTFNEMIVMDLFYLENMSILLDLKIMLKTGGVIAGQLLESQRGHNAIGPGANRTKVARGDFPTSVPVTAIRMGFEIDHPTKTTLENKWDCDRHASERMRS